LSGGTFAAGTTYQTIPYGQVSPLLQPSAPLGGSCSNNYTYQWYSSTDDISFTQIPNATDATYHSAFGLTATTYYKRLATCGTATAYTTNEATVNVLPLGYGVPGPTTITGNANTNMNWIQSRSYDAGRHILIENKEFFDNSGRSVQMQDKVFYRKDVNTTYTHVFASQPIRDAYGRDAAMTMAAPIDCGDFNYQPNFVQHNAAGNNYNHQNFDWYNSGSGDVDKSASPDPLWDASTGTPVKGTLAWYYSSTNNWEGYTPVTGYPFSRQIYYQDGTGNVKKAATAGEALRMGSGHEISSYGAPVAGELDFYLQVRNKYFATTDVGSLPVSLASQAMQMTGHDPNGREAVSIQDRSGRTLMSARPGGSDVVVNNTVNIAAGSFQQIKLSGNSTLTFTGSGTVYQMDSYAESTVSFIPGGHFNSGGSNVFLFPAGYYKIVNTDPVNPATVSYTTGFTDVSFSFYNQLGQLVATIAPEGVKKLYGTNGTGLNNYATKTAVPFISLLNYDLRGRLVSTQDPDGGIHQYIYRNDGNIRFSQSPVQAGSGSFTYSNYDALGRVVESGQYQPDAAGIVFGSAAMTGILENTTPGGGLTTGTKTDVSVNQYDVPDNSHGLTGYVQDAFNVGGAVSLTQKYSSIVNNSPNSTNLQSATWYNYNEEGKVMWTIKYINGLGAGTAAYKTTDYSYDAMGRMVTKTYQAGTSTETFIHYYDYDPANGQLWHVNTGRVVGGSKQLQATYYYYLHGGVKRVELAGSLQGVDYIYTLQGALKAINNSNKTQDPGNDGNNGLAADAFGEVLDYYPQDYINGRSGVAAINGVNTSAIVTQESYAGNIKAMSWFSEKPASTGLTDAPNVYVYQYDPKYQFTESTWGTGLNFGSAPAGFTATAYNKEKIGNPSASPAVLPYDENGNIQYLQRTDGSGTSRDLFTYNYIANTNKLSGVVNTASGTAQTYATYSYDANGQVTAEATTDGTAKYLVYDVMGMVTAVFRDAAHTQPIAGFVYDEMGRRIKKLSYNTSYQLSQVTYYVGDVIYTQPVTGGGTSYGTVSAQEYQIEGSSGRIGIYYAQSNIYAYELADHLGNVRAVIAQSGTTYQVRMYTDYYPYGMVISSGVTNDYRYGYQGQYAEADPETGWNNFELRMYDSRIARWLQYDPAGQFFSPYMAMGNSPVDLMDMDGGEAGDGDAPKDCPNCLPTAYVIGFYRHTTTTVPNNSSLSFANLFAFNRNNLIYKFIKSVNAATDVGLNLEKKVGVIGVDYSWGKMKFKADFEALSAGFDLKTRKLTYTMYNLDVNASMGDHAKLGFGVSMEEGTFGEDMNLFNGSLSYEFGKKKASVGGTVMSYNFDTGDVDMMTMKSMSMKHKLSEYADLSVDGDATKIKLKLKAPNGISLKVNFDYGKFMESMTQ